MGKAYSVPKVASKWYDEEVKSLPSLEGKIIAITGCTSGMGLVCARTCAQKGASIILLNRPSDRAVAALKTVQEVAVEGASVTHVDCDLQDFDSVRSAAAEVNAKVGSAGLNVLCNNAGVMALPDKATSAGYDVQAQTNHLSHFLLTSELMPALKAAAAGSAGEARVVSHSSISRKSPGTALQEKYFGKNGGNLGGDSVGARYERYHQTKLANAVFTVALQDRLDAANLNIKAAVVAPGLAASNLQATTADSGGGLGLSILMKGAQSEEDGSLPLIHCVAAESIEKGQFMLPKFKGLIGSMMGDGIRGPPVVAKLEPLCTDQKAKDMLWAASEAATGKFAI